MQKRNLRMSRRNARTNISKGGTPEGIHMEQLKQLSTLALTINKETDSYTQSLVALEAKLNALGLGIRAWVPLYEQANSGDPSRSSSKRLLFGYGKSDDGWGFLVQEVRVERGYFQGDTDCPWEETYEDEPPKSLLKSSRELRISAAAKLEDLLNVLVTRANDVIPTLQKAKELATSW